MKFGDFRRNFGQDGKMDAVKLEGGRRVADMAAAVADAGINIMGHIGLTPQTAAALGGYRIQGKSAEAAEELLADARALQVIPTPSHLLDRISPIFSPFFPVFCAFSPPRQDGSNEPQAGTQGRETAGTGTKSSELRPSFDTAGANQRINWQRPRGDAGCPDCEPGTGGAQSRLLHDGRLHRHRHRAPVRRLPQQFPRETKEEVDPGTRGRIPRLFILGAT